MSCDAGPVKLALFLFVGLASPEESHFNTATGNSKSSRELGSVDKVENCSSWLDEVDLPVLEFTPVVIKKMTHRKSVKLQLRLASVPPGKMMLRAAQVNARSA
ncbi:hypothetical protein OOU_Y34scaffold01040g3 [Pyricularia oryzae Y34]|uniref:Secreted protein n=1 Tax=Pyricularia oryzae (strain Y34) TaxID=1143189 RepID=A0AA97PFK9_PYRO3|nr:hypothetical protein OOU_Y34scaffold01040g3 [Pyricularia oryzae Y34]